MPCTLLQLGSIFEWRLASQQIGPPRASQQLLLNLIDEEEPPTIPTTADTENCNSSVDCSAYPPWNQLLEPSPWFCGKKTACFEAENCVVADV